MACPEKVVMFGRIKLFVIEVAVLVVFVAFVYTVTIHELMLLFR